MANRSGPHRRRRAFALHLAVRLAWGAIGPLNRAWLAPQTNVDEPILTSSAENGFIGAERLSHKELMRRPRRFGR